MVKANAALRYGICRFWQPLQFNVGFNQLVRARYQHVNRRNHEQRERRSNDHAADQHDADAVAAPAPGPLANTRGKWPNTVAAVVIRIGRSRVLAASMMACKFVSARSLADDWRTRTIRMPFFDDQSHQRDQSDLAVDVQRRESQEREHQRAGDGQRNRSGQNDERIAEALELRREHQIDQDPESRNVPRNLLPSTRSWRDSPA